MTSQISGLYPVTSAFSHGAPRYLRAVAFATAAPIGVSLATRKNSLPRLFRQEKRFYFGIFNSYKCFYVSQEFETDAGFFRLAAALPG